MIRQPTTVANPWPGSRLLRLRQVLEITGLCKSQLYRLLAAGKFPKPVRVGPRTVRWTLESILAWIENLPQE